MFWSLDWNQSRQLANGGQGDKERGKRGAAPVGGGCGFPSCLEGGQPPGNRTRSEATPQAPAFFSPFLRGEPSVCNGFSSPETVVLLHQTLLSPQAGDSSSAAPEPAPPTRPAPPLLASPLASSSHPPTHPDPASQLRGQRAKYLRRRRRGCQSARLCHRAGDRRTERGQGRRGTEKERGQPARVGAARGAPSAAPGSLPRALGSGLLPPALRPPLRPYSCLHTRSIRPKPPALFSLIFHFLFSPQNYTKLIKPQRSAPPSRSGQQEKHSHLHGRHHHLLLLLFLPRFAPPFSAPPAPPPPLSRLLSQQPVQAGNFLSSPLRQPSSAE